MNLTVTRIRTRKNVPDGIHKGIVQNLMKKGDKFILVVNVSFEGAIAKLYYSIYECWDDGCSFVEMLEDFEILKDIGEDINLAEIIEKPVIAEIKNNYVGENQYSNIIKINFDKEVFQKTREEEEKLIEEAEEMFNN